jgi:hypothetical protein
MSAYRRYGMSLYCPRCGSQCIRETVTADAEVVIHLVPGHAPELELNSIVEDLTNMQLVSLECVTCGYCDDDPDADWARIPDQVQRDEWLDWADNRNDERKLGGVR